MISEDTSASGHEDRRGDLLLLAVACLLLFFALGGRALWSSEERWAEIPREMFLTGDFFHPTIGGEPYFDKPLLTYWVIALAASVTRGLNEWSVRLPSAIAGLVTIWATLSLGRRLWSARVGRVAGWLLLLSFGFLFWSRTAAAETENLAAITVCTAWYWARRGRVNFTTYLVFYLIAFLGALTKGLTALVVPILIILPDMLVERRWRMLFKPAHLAAVAIGLGVYVAPFAIAWATQPEGYGASGLALVFKENILRYVKPFDHVEPITSYLYGVPMIVMPWAPLLVGALIAMIASWKRLQRQGRWLLAAMGLVFLFFTLSGSRRWYYILPIAPLCALAMAVFACRMEGALVERVRRRVFPIQWAFLLAIAAVFLAAPIALVVLKNRIGFAAGPALGISAVALGLAALTGAALAYRSPRLAAVPKPLRAICAMIVVATVLLGGYFCSIQRILDGYRTGRPFALELGHRVRRAGIPAERIGIYPKRDATLFFYMNLNRPIRILRSPQALREFVAQTRPGMVIVRRKHEEDLRAALADGTRPPDLAEAVQPWESDDKKWAAWLLENGKNAEEKAPDAR